MGHLYRKSYKLDGEKKTVGKWYGCYRDASGKRVRVPLAKRKDVSAKMLADLEAEVEREKAGMIVAPKKGLMELVTEWLGVMQSRGCVEKHIKSYRRAVLWFFRGSGVTNPRDITLPVVEAYLLGMRGSVRTRCAALAGIRAFLNWCAVKGIYVRSPIYGYSPRWKPDQNRVKIYRPMTRDEAQKLLDTTISSGRRMKLSGEDRCMLYRLAMCTGMRVRELGRLTPQHFDFTTGFIYLKTDDSKHRMRDIIPIHPDIKEDLRKWMDGRDGVLFPGGWTDGRGAELLHGDLEEAGIPIKTDEGDLDFHSLRHTYTTWLAAAGLTPLQVMRLARHSTITLTMSVYAHRSDEDAAKDLASVPMVAPVVAKICTPQPPGDPPGR